MSALTTRKHDVKGNRHDIGVVVVAAKYKAEIFISKDIPYW